MQVGRLPEFLPNTASCQKRRAAKAARQVAALQFRGDVFYAVSVPALKLVKFGYSNNVLKRFNSYQEHIPATVELLAVLHAPKRVESAVHECFRPYRAHANEWYPLEHPEVKKFLDALVLPSTQDVFTKYAADTTDGYRCPDPTPLMRALGLDTSEILSRCRRAYKRRLMTEEEFYAIED
jgi:hypothetical protein